MEVVYMKKFFAILVTMAILVSSVCIALPSAAADKAASYTVTADADYAAKKVSVTVEMTENSGLSGCIIDLTYDANVLTCTSAAAGSVWTGDVEANTANEGEIPTELNRDSAEEMTGFFTSGLSRYILVYAVTISAAHATSNTWSKPIL